jgi:predicted small lipoprotein YifL
MVKCMNSVAASPGRMAGAVALMAMVALTSACGQKGPLRLAPAVLPAAATPASAASSASPR